jgi:serine/threonine protein kinase
MFCIRKLKLSTPVSLAPPVAHLTSLFLQDIQEKNILLDLDDVSALEAFEKEELTSPSARKVVGDRIVYLSKEIVTSDYGRPVLCDFGEARFGKATYTDDIQPYQYRAPEVILGVPWGQKVDIWSVGVMVRPFFSKSRCTYI